MEFCDTKLFSLAIFPILFTIPSKGNDNRHAKNLASNKVSEYANTNALGTSSISTLKFGILSICSIPSPNADIVKTIKIKFANKIKAPLVKTWIEFSSKNWSCSLILKEAYRPLIITIKQDNHTASNNL